MPTPLFACLRAAAALLRTLAARLPRRRPPRRVVLPLGCRVQHWTGGYVGTVVRTEQRVADFMRRIAPTGRDRWPELIAIAEAVRPLDGIAYAGAAARSRISAECSCKAARSQRIRKAKNAAR